MTVRVIQSFAGEGPRLYICSTPIGNLQDASLRLLDVLREVDVVAAEDTRQTRKLLAHFDIHPPLLVSLHQHNEAAREADLRRWWAEGKRVALVSDAGTPLVSDPGEGAVGLAVELGVPVIPVPGASAVLTALVASGCAVQPFTFLGFLPREKKRAKKLLDAFSSVPGALVLYEAPHRLVSTLRLLAEQMPARRIALGKELTKLHETFYYADDAAELAAYFAEQQPRGEYVIVLGPPEAGQHGEPDDKDADRDNEEEAVRMVVERVRAGASHASAVREVAKLTGMRRQQLYQLTLAVKSSGDGWEQEGLEDDDEGE
jgi:16S rRNA (cytidine1402-2'-O)-methyltransferase